MCPSSKMLSHNQSCERQCGVCAHYTGPKRTASQRVDAVIGVSRFVLQKHIDSGYFANASTTGVINDCYLPMQSEAPTAVSNVVREGVVRLGVLGRVSPEKGIEVLLDQLCRDSSLNWRLTIGGSGDAAYLATLKSTYNDPRINFAISTRGMKPGVDHLGIQVDTKEELAEMKARAEAARLTLHDVGEAAGTIRRQDGLDRRAIADNAHLKTVVAA